MQLVPEGYRAGTSWVADRVADLRARWGGTVTVDTASQGLVPGALEPSQRDQAKAHNLLADLVGAAQVRHGSEPALDVSVRAARWKPLG